MSRRSAREWTQEEHARYVQALELFPNAPWKVIAAHVGSRTARQVMTHANKIALKQQRHARGLRRAGRPRQDNATEVTASQPTPRRLNRRTKEKQEASMAPASYTNFLGFLLDSLVLPNPSDSWPLCFAANAPPSPDSISARVFGFVDDAIDFPILDADGGVVV